jgi:hypothetical protein
MHGSMNIKFGHYICVEGKPIAPAVLLPGNDHLPTAVPDAMAKFPPVPSLGNFSGSPAYILVPGLINLWAVIILSVDRIRPRVPSLQALQY